MIVAIAGVWLVERAFDLPLFVARGRMTLGRRPDAVSGGDGCPDSVGVDARARRAWSVRGSGPSHGKSWRCW